MTKNDNLFDIVNIKFDADEAQSLIGKKVFVSDSLINIRDAVNEMRTDSPCYYGKLISAQTSYSARGSSFKIDCDDRTFKYVYYDPYYELKCAFKRGETIEYQDDVCSWRAVNDPEFKDKPEYYRIKSNKPALKWQDLKIGDILRGPINSCFDRYSDFYGTVTMIDTRKSVDRHIYFGSYWINDEEICKLHRVNAAGEDIE